MPELPDVETFSRYVDATALHKRIEAVEVDAPRMLQGVSRRRLAGALEGARFRGTKRHGKFLFLEIEDDGCLVLHFGMTGFLTYWKDPEKRPGNARLSIRFADGHALAGSWPRRLGRIALTGDKDAFVKRQALGPDAWAIGEGDFVRLFRGRRGSVKAALMDQKFLAGLGNVYSDEALFQARLHPGRAIKGLSGSELQRLYRAMRHVLRLAVERQADPDRLPKTWLLLHRQANARCPRCGGGVETRRLAGRTAYFCPACQTEPG